MRKTVPKNQARALRLLPSICMRFLRLRLNRFDILAKLDSASLSSFRGTLRTFEVTGGESKVFQNNDAFFTSLYLSIKSSYLV